MTPRSKTIAAIASRHLNVTTLETRDSDCLDFHDCAVWDIRAALIAAYEAGRSSALQNPGQD